MAHALCPEGGGVGFILNVIRKTRFESRPAKKYIFHLDANLYSLGIVWNLGTQHPFIYRSKGCGENEDEELELQGSVKPAGSRAFAFVKAYERGDLI